ncbi:MAG: RagB/SusD family nutrient uptake outer membrane protein, partial [Bacteroidales bacterium]|nr:RagB/SusD family nutrient uptake outer membrane protein [Bacteroidales bacterium]
INIIFAALLLLMSTTSCTDLTEELYSTITTDSFYRNEQECLLGLGNVYTGLRQTNSLWGAYSVQVLSTDEAVIPLRNAGYSLNNNGVFLAMHEHNWMPQRELIGGAWNLYMSIASKCNDVISAIEKSPATFDSKASMIAEMKVLRAFAYYNAMDLFGNIPVVLDIEDRSLPQQRTRSEAFDLIEAELLENYLTLDAHPSAKKYGRMTQPVALMILAKMYLNAEKWTGTPRYTDAIEMCDKIITSGDFILTPNFFDNFKILNTGSKENIFVIPYDRTVDSWGFTHNIIGLPPSLMKKYQYNLAWNGICAIPAFYDKYDQADKRIKSFEVGVQYDWDGVTPIKALNGSNLTFTNTISNILGANEAEGARFFKYEYPVGLSWLQSMDNDWAVYRYADVLLIKAEAIIRNNGGNATQQAVDLVNQVRERAFGDASHNYTIETLTLLELYDERGRELAWEGHRRQDQIRFGTFGDAWFEKEAWTDNHKELFPIPASPLLANPNLQQNEGYN